jgi:hypothetical protein
MADGWTVPQEFRQRCAEAGERELKEINAYLLRCKHPELTDFMQRRAAVRLRFLIKKRKAEGQWPPSGDEVDADPELTSLMREAWQEEVNATIAGPDFQAAVKLQARREKRHVNAVLQRAAAQRDRALTVKRTVFKQRARKVVERKRK